MYFINAEVCCHMFRYPAGIAGEHNCLLHACFLQRLYRLFCMRFLNIGNHDMSGIAPVYSHMDDRSRLMADDPFDAQSVHEL